METAIMDRRKWLVRLIYVRLAAFTIFVAAELLRKPSADLLVLLGAVYALSLWWSALLKLNHSYAWQLYAQITVDLLLITWTVNRTSGSTTIVWPDLLGQYIISLSIFGFCSVGFLSNFLAESWRKTGVELQKSTGQVAFLQAFSDRIVDSLGSGLVTTDVEGRIYLFNHAAAETTGYPPHEALKMTIWEVFPGMGDKIQPGRSEISTTHREGVPINIRFSVSPVMIDEKNRAGYVWSFDDVTELRLLERQVRQEAQMAAIGAMLAGIAHEIRNPLASIAGSFNLLQSDLDLDEDQRQLVEIISRETERLNRTINQFLSYGALYRPSEGRPSGAYWRDYEVDAK